MPVTTKFNLGVSFVKSGGSTTASGGAGPLKLVYHKSYDEDGFLIASNTTITGTPKTLVFPDNPYEELYFYFWLGTSGVAGRTPPGDAYGTAHWIKNAYANSIVDDSANTGGLASRVVHSFVIGDSSYDSNEDSRLSTEDNLKINVGRMSTWNDVAWTNLNYVSATQTLTLDTENTRNAAQMADTNLQARLLQIIIMGR